MLRFLAHSHGAGERVSHAHHSVKANQSQQTQMQFGVAQSVNGHGHGELVAEQIGTNWQIGTARTRLAGAHQHAFGIKSAFHLVSLQQFVGVVKVNHGTRLLRQRKQFWPAAWRPLNGEAELWIVLFLHNAADEFVGREVQEHFFLHIQEQRQAVPKSAGGLE